MDFFHDYNILNLEKDVEDNIYDFHPTDTPRGTFRYYNNDLLLDRDKRMLRKRKIERVRANQRYLARHPEIKIMVILLLRHLLHERPRINIRSRVSNYFMNRSPLQILFEINTYLKENHRNVELVALRSSTESTRSIQSYCRRLVEDMFVNAMPKREDPAQSFQSVCTYDVSTLFDDWLINHQWEEF